MSTAQQGRRQNNIKRAIDELRCKEDQQDAAPLFLKYARRILIEMEFMNKPMNVTKTQLLRCGVLLLAMSTQALQAQSSDAMQSWSEKLNIQPVLDLSYGVFYSDQSYQDPHAQAHKAWQEAYALYGLSAEYQHPHSTLYASLSGVSTASFADGDAAGFTQGTERKTNVEEWRIGWRNGRAEDASVDLSLGRQNVQIADGFLAAGRGLSLRLLLRTL